MLKSRVLFTFLIVTVTGLVPTHTLQLSYAADNEIVKEADAPRAQMSHFKTGATLTRDSLNPWDSDAEALSRGKALLDSSTSIGVQHLHGFGGVFPLKEDDSYDWESMERRFNTTLSGVDTKVLTACCAPQYMEVPPKDGEDPNEWAPYLRPKQEFFDRYTATVVETVQKYPDIEYIQVWNEMKGFWLDDKQRWDYEAYTELYNKIWDAVKAVRPDIKIGGPYVVLNSYGAKKNVNNAHIVSDVGGKWGAFDKRDLDVVRYWLREKNGADFLTVDGKNRNRDGIEWGDPFERTEKFGVFMNWLRGLDENECHGCRTLPVWWAEWYARLDNESTASQAEKNAVMATGLIRTLRSGAQTAIIWAPQGDTYGNSFPLGIFNSTENSTGGQATPFYHTQKYLHDHFSAGTMYIDHTSSNAGIESLLSSSHLLLVNMKPTSQTTTINSRDYNLGAYEVRLEEVEETNHPAPPSGLTIDYLTGKP